MQRNHKMFLSWFILISCMLCCMPSGAKADYAPDGISALWWNARMKPEKVPPNVMALNTDWETEQRDNNTTWSRTLPPCPFADPALVIANLNAGWVEVLLDGTSIYSFGTKTSGFARPQAANAIHWIPLPAAQYDRTLQIRTYTLDTLPSSHDLPMILYAASTPLLRHLQRAAAARITLALLFAFVGVYAGFAWFVRRRYGMRFSPWFAVLTLSLGLGLLIASIMEFLTPAVSTRIYYIGLLLILLFPAALWRFMEEALGAGPWKMIRRCWQLQLLVAALLWLPDILGILAFGTTAQFVGNSVLALQLCVGAWVGTYYIRKGDTAQIWIALGIFLLSIAGLIDIAGAILVGDPSFELYPFGALALVLLLAYVQERAAGEAQRLLRRQAEALHRHQTHLEELVETRTAQLRESTKAAQAASQAKSEFLANMSHELRTPLNAILGHAQRLRKQTDASQDIAQRGDIIQQSGEHLLTLINDILDLARIESGRLDINMGEMHLPSLLTGIMDMLKPRAEQKSLEFTLTQKTAIPEIVVTDGRRIRQILLNLAGNAIKFTEQGFVRIEVAYQDAALQVSIEDTGPGITEEDCTRIFEAFEQGATSASQDGTGLGLSISRSLAKRLGGDISVNSKTGQGSKFRLHIPCQALGETNQNTPATPQYPLPMPQRKTKPKPQIHHDYKVLQEAARIGDIATITAQIPFLQQRHPEDKDLLQQLEQAANNFDIDQIQKQLLD